MPHFDEREAATRDDADAVEQFARDSLGPVAPRKAAREVSDEAGGLRSGEHPEACDRS